MNSTNSKILLIAIGFALLSASCELPNGNDLPSTVASEAPEAEHPGGSPGLAISPIAKQVLNLGVMQSLAVTVTGTGPIPRKVHLSADLATLRLSDPMSKISVSFQPDQIEVSASHPGTSTVTLFIDPAAPALDSSFTIAAAADGDGSHSPVTLPVGLQVKAVYEIGMMGAPQTGPATPELWSAPASVVFATHPEGILIRFVNKDTRQAHVVHSSGTPIPHQGTSAANQSSTGAQPSTLKAATGTAAGGVYEYMVTTQSKVTDTYYCHSHDNGTDAHTLTFNAYAAPVTPKPTTNPNAKFSIINANILQPKCAGCHGTAGGFSFASYTSTLKAVTAGNPSLSPLYLSVAPGGNMPQGAVALSASEVQAISDWITSGAPNN